LCGVRLMLAGTPATSSPLRQLLLGPGGNRRRGGWLGLFGEREVDLTERRQLGISGFKPRCHPRDGKSLIHGLRFFSRRPKDQPTQGYSCGLDGSDVRWERLHRLNALTLEVLACSRIASPYSCLKRPTFASATNTRALTTPSW
jgi:hypothetical protein